MNKIKNDLQNTVTVNKDQIMNDNIDQESKNEINVEKQLRGIGKSSRQRYQNDQRDHSFGTYVKFPEN